jgi:hypothetical protein
MVFDATSKVIAPEDKSGDDVESIQLFGTKCENWDDVAAVLKERPNLLERFLFLYRKLLKYLALTLFSRCRGFRISRLLDGKCFHQQLEDNVRTREKRES